MNPYRQAERDRIAYLEAVATGLKPGRFGMTPERAVAELARGLDPAPLPAPIGDRGDAPALLWRALRLARSKPHRLALWRVLTALIRGGHRAAWMSGRIRFRASRRITPGSVSALVACLDHAGAPHALEAARRSHPRIAAQCMGAPVT